MTKEKNLNDVLKDLYTAIEKTVEQTNTPDNVQSLEKVIKEVPNLLNKDKTYEIASAIAETSTQMAKQNVEALAEDAAKYIVRVPLHTFVYECIESYKKKGGDTSGLFDDVCAAVKYMKIRGLIKAENGHVLLSLEYNKEEQKNKK
jgi:hypothetical protein